MIAAGCGGGDPESGEPDRSQDGSSVGALEPGQADGPPRPRGAKPLRGAESVVFFGDSLAAAGPPTYADRLAEDPGSLVEVINLAEAGTSSEDWRPGGELFDQTLTPWLDDADLALVTVGGNDLQAAFGAEDGPDALGAERSDSRLARVAAAFTRIEQNLRRMFRAIRKQNPKVAIAYVGYPDYSKASAWAERTDTFGLIALRTGLERLGDGARAAGADHVVEMLDVTAAAGVDSLLSDAEHLGEQGHALYLERIVERLRGR